MYTNEVNMGILRFWVPIDCKTYQTFSGNEVNLSYSFYRIDWLENR